MSGHSLSDTHGEGGGEDHDEVDGEDHCVVGGEDLVLPAAVKHSSDLQKVVQPNQADWPQAIGKSRKSMKL